MLVERKKIHIAKTKSEVIFNGIGYVFFIGSIILLAIIWDHIPTEVPAHYKAAGVVDRWGSKWELIILPSTSLDRKSTRLNSSHVAISYAVFCLKKTKKIE